MRLFALVVLVAGLAVPPAGADEFSATFQFEDVEFVASSAFAFDDRLGAEVPWQSFTVVFTDFTVDLQDVHESLDRDTAFVEQAHRVGGNVLWAYFDGPRMCRIRAFASRLRRDPRFHGPGPQFHSRQAFPGEARTGARRRVVGACEGEMAVDLLYPHRISTPLPFRVAFEGATTASVAAYERLRISATSGAPEAALQAFMTAVAARDLATVQRHISRDQWPVDAGDERALEAYFAWLPRAYPSEAVVVATLSTATAARLDIEGKKDGRRVKGPVNLRMVEGTWRITDAPLTWLEWPWDVKR